MRYFQLRAFDAVARQRSFSKAAELLGLTQPAITMQVRNLERACGQALFSRAGRQIELTEPGTELLALTRQIFEIEDRIETFINAANELAQGNLRIAADGPHVALEVIAAFRQRYPGIDVAVTLGSQRAVWQDVLDYRVDAAIIGNPAADDRLTVVPITRQDMMVLLPASHRLATRPKLRLADLAGEGMIRREAGSNTQRVLDQELRRAGLNLPVVLELGSREAVREAVALGLGIGFLFERECTADPRLIAVPLSDMRGTNLDAVICLSSQRKRRIVQAFIETATMFGKVSKGRFSSPQSTTS
jgi:aminoethylphosphonate catabolism LysR family transcriptional regulator